MLPRHVIKAPLCSLAPPAGFLIAAFTTFGDSHWSSAPREGSRPPHGPMMLWETFSYTLTGVLAEIQRCVTGFWIKRRAESLAVWGVGTDISGRVIAHTPGDFFQTGKMFGWWGVKDQQGNSDCPKKFFILSYKWITFIPTIILNMCSDWLVQGCQGALISLRL